MKRVAAPHNERLLASWDGGEDAALWTIDDTRIGILTLDFITPVVDDPYDFGQIAAANAISDVFAMGGKPLFALNVVAFPTNCEPLEVLEKILEGGAVQTTRAGAILAGGHSVQDEEPKYGLVVYGETTHQKIWRVSGARDGDALILTKPLGTGVAVTAIKAGLFAGEHIEESVRSMSQLNALPILLSDELHTAVHACTDVTGFGLAGHALDMLVTSDRKNLNLAIDSRALPLLGGVVEAADMGLVPAGTYTNRERYAPRCETRVAEADRVQKINDFAFDPQTSGGLLLAVDPAKADAILALLAQNGFDRAAIIGHFEATDEKGRLFFD